MDSNLGRLQVSLLCRPPTNPNHPWLMDLLGKRKRMSLLYLLAQGQGHKGILGLVLPSETPTNSPPLIITNHLHKLHFQSTMHNRTTNHHHRTTNHHHLSTKINHQPTKKHHQITKPMYQPIKVLDKTTQITIIYPALT